MSFAVSFKQHSLGDLELESQRFTNKHAIKPWLLSCLLASRSIHVVIERSDKHKIIFKCKAGGYKLEAKYKRRQKSCPFRIRANYSIRNQVWTLLVINDQHDHAIGSHEEEQGESKDGDDVADAIEEDEDEDDDEDVTEATVNERKVRNDSYQNGDYQGSNAEFMETTDSSRSSPQSSKTSSTSDVFSLFIPSASISSPNSIKEAELMDNLELMAKKRKNSRGMYLERKNSRGLYLERKNSRGMFERKGAYEEDKTVFEDKADVFEDKTDVSDVFVEDKRAVYEEKSDEYDKRDIFKTDIYEPTKSLNLALQTLQILRDEVSAIINKRITDNNIFSSGEKSELMKEFVSQFLNDRKISISKHPSPIPEKLYEADDNSSRQYQNQKSDLTSWLTTTNTNPNALGSNNTNLIPLSPLLNDDAEYNGSAQHTTSSANNANNIDNLTQLPGLSILSGSTSNPILTSSSLSHTTHSFTFPNQIQLLQIHNQAQQLPSFNSIQNQLPLSPNSLSNTSTPSLFGSTSLIPPTNTNTTLSPASLLKSNKNVVASNQQLSNLLNLSEFKLNNSNNSFLLSGHNSHLSYFTNPGVSSPNNNIISQANSQNRDHSHNQGSNNHSGALNMSSLADTGW